MNKKPLFFLFFISLFYWILFGIDIPSKVGKFALQFNSSSAPLSFLKNYTLKEKQKDELEVLFEFTIKTSWQIEWDAMERTLVVYLFNMSRKQIRQMLSIHRDFFEKISLSWSKEKIYRISFQLKTNVVPLPYTSKGSKKQLALSFSKQWREKTKQEIAPPLKIEKAPAITHLSNQYEQKSPEDTNTIETPLTDKALSQDSNKKTNTKEHTKYQSLQNAQIFKIQDIKIRLEEDGIYSFELQRNHPYKNRIFGALVDKDIAKTRFSIGLSREKLLGTEILSTIARRNNATLAINGSYFSTNGDPIGILIKNFRLLSAPVLSRSCFGILEDGTPFIGQPSFQGEVLTNRGILQIEGLNQINKESTILYTPEFGIRTPARKDCIQISIQNSEIIRISTEEHLVPVDGYVLSASLQRFPWIRELTAFSRVVVSYGLTPPWSKMRHAIGGGPSLVTDSIAEVSQNESFKSDFLSARAPRSAIGIDKNNHLLFVVVDGRQEQSKGMTLKELSLLMQELGSVHAMNLDGGGSTSIFLADKIQNSPSDGKERAVSNALLILSSSK